MPHSILGQSKPFPPTPFPIAAPKFRPAACLRARPSAGTRRLKRPVVLLYALCWSLSIPDLPKSIWPVFTDGLFTGCPAGPKIRCRAIPLFSAFSEESVFETTGVLGGANPVFWQVGTPIFCVLSTSKRASPRSKPCNALGQPPFLWCRHPMER